MGKQLSYVLTFLAGLALGAVAGTQAREKSQLKKPTLAKVCRDLELIVDLEVADAQAAADRGDNEAAQEHGANAAHATAGAERMGCGWAS